MPDVDSLKEAKNFGVGIPQKSECFFLKGCGSLDWGMKNRLARIFNPASGRTAMLAIDHGRPKVMNLKELMQCFIAHRFEVVKRRAQFDLEKAEARAHILEGLKIALDHLDAVVRVIRESMDRDVARRRTTPRPSPPSTRPT